MKVNVFIYCSFMDRSFIILTCRFEEQEAPGSRLFFTEIIALSLDIKFSKFWDIYSIEIT